MLIADACPVKEEIAKLCRTLLSSNPFTQKHVCNFTMRKTFFK